MPASAVAPARWQTNPTRELTIVAEWIGRTPLLELVEVSYEKPAPGPRGIRVRVIEDDASTRRSVKPALIPVASDIEAPAFHVRSVYGVTMHTLWPFESALRRNVGWSFAFPLSGLARRNWTGAREQGSPSGFFLMDVRT